MANPEYDELTAKVSEMKRILTEFENQVIKLLKDASRFKSPPVPAMPWTGGELPHVRREKHGSGYSFQLNKPDGAAQNEN